MSTNSIYPNTNFKTVIFTWPQFVCGGTISRKSTRFLICAFGAALFLFSHLHAGAALPLPELKVDTHLATAGFYRLEWQLDTTDTDGLNFELQESRDSDFQDAASIYQGPDLATVLSGRGDGIRYYRVRAFNDGRPASDWSETVTVETKHHSLARALSFFAIGAIVFALTLGLVLRGGKD